MRKLKLFLSCLLMAVLSIGQVWATEAEYVITSQALAVTLNGEESTAWTINSGSFGSYNATKGAQTTAASFEITCPETYSNVTSIVVYYSTNNNSTALIAAAVGSQEADQQQVEKSKTNSSLTFSFSDAGDDQTISLSYSRNGNAGSLYIKKIVVTYTDGGGSQEPTVKSVQFNPNGGNFVGSQSVTLSQEDNKTIYYTTNATAGAGDPSTSSPWALYESSLNLTATTTIYAAAKDGDDWSSVTSKTFTKIEPLTTMAEVQAEVPSSGTKQINVTITNWVVTAVSGNQVWIADATNEKGILLYKSGHGFVVGNQLNGTVLGTGLTKYNGAAELNSLTKADVSVTTAATLTPRVTTIAALTSNHPAEQGTVVKLENVTYNGTAFSDGVNTIIIDTRFYDPTLESSKKYDLIGVVFYGSSNAIKLMPRTSADIEEIVPAGAPEFNPASKKFVGSISVELSQENSLPIYYTDDASKKDAPSITIWTEYTSAIPVTATKTIYAAAKDGDDWSDVVDATYTLADPLTTMEAVQGAATSTESNIDVTITNWVVTAVDNIGSADNKRVWIADADNMKGILLYDGSASHGFVVGKKLNGTVLDTKIQLYQGYAELKSLKAADVDVTDAEAITARKTTIADLATGRPAEQGTIVKLENVTYNGTAFTDGENTISIDTRLYEPTLTNGKKYNLTGVVFYSSATAIKIMPRAAADVEELASHDLISISLSGTYPTNFETGDEFSHEGMVVTAHYDGAEDATVTASATFSGYDMSATGEQTVTVTYEENEVSKTAEYTITVNAPAPTGDFELLEGELVAGDYLIYEGGSLMKAEISSSRFAYEEATPDANGIISNPSQYAVWTLAKSGDYWTFYNAKAGKYAAGTGVANKAQLLADGTDDKSLWSINGDLVVTNKANAAAEVNATLRHNFSGNTNYGFACYAASTGNQPVFYKPATPSYYITEALTGCSAAEGNPTKVPQALTDDVVLKYNLTAGYAWPNAITVKVGETTLNPDDVEYIWDNTKTPAELTIDQTVVDGDITVTIAAELRELSSISISQAPTKTAYFVGDVFNPAGLQIQLIFTSGDPETVVYNDDTKDDFSFSPDLETALTVDDNEVVITYEEKTANQAISVTAPTPVAKTVVIIAEYNNKFYAMSNAVSSSACAAISVTKDGPNLVAESEEDKAAIQWLMTTTGNSVTFQDADSKFLSSAANDGALSKADDVVNWSVTEDGEEYLISIGDARSILYRTSGIFKHYSKNNLTQNPTEYFKVSEFFEVAEDATNILIVAPVVHEFVVDPDEAVAFGTVNQGDEVEAKSFAVSLTNIESATVTLEGGEGAFSIDKTTLDENGGTITVTPNTAIAGNFSATITLSDEAGLADNKVINVTMRVVEPRDCDRTDDFSKVGANSSYTDRASTEGWTAVNTAVAVKDEVTYWIMQGNTDKVGVITSPEFNYGIEELSLGYYYPFGESNGISFKIEIKQNGSVVKEKTITKSDATQNTVYDATFEEINVVGKYQIVITNLSPTGSTSSKDRFAVGNLCWKTYGDPVKDEIRTGLEANRYYTVCLNQKVVKAEGATFWNLAKRDEGGTVAYLEEAQLPLEAGAPYIFQTSNGKLEVIYDGKATDAAGVNGALFGTFVAMNQAAIDQASDDNNSSAIYMLSNNELRLANGRSGNTISAHRAYIVYEALDIVSSTPQPAPGKRVVAIPMHQDQATGVDELNAAEAPVKMIIDGQLFILRGEKMYDATGRLVK